MALCALLALSLVLCSAHVSAVDYLNSGKAIIVFGDSLSDNGNFYMLTNDTRPASVAVINGTTYQTYYKGRFTNSPGVWNDHLKFKMKRTVIANFAFGGAAMCNIAGVPIPHVTDQVEMYISKMKTDIKYRNRLQKYTRYPVIWAGSNDVQYMLSTDPIKLGTLAAGIVECMVNATKHLLDNGEDVVVLGTMAPLDQTPLAIGIQVNGIIATLITGININIKKAVTQLSAAYKAKKKSVVVWDVYADSTADFKNYLQLGFKHNVLMDCLNVPPTFSALRGSIPTYVCPKPDEYLFFDDLHPTSRAHKTIAESFIDQLSLQGLITNDDLKKPRKVM